MVWSKKTIWQGILFAIIVEMALLGFNFPLISSMFIGSKEEDFVFHDSYFVVYHGFLDNSPKLALLFWMVLIFITAVSLFILLKTLWRIMRSR
ncbi:hypothetical protein PaecuDRAFT_4579 [Paenibacillus curdlanolyticus YK9]|uniref:Uncharacterized protein n=2 Tax=Paenibacillus curdlanolyticus TaxID=59840 RepID=E0IFY8_9BACL|nr:hypothetical protein PaecuDRAFT_4579 [Paenibacillus curdlanolyticus YK9]